MPCVGCTGVLYGIIIGISWVTFDLMTPVHSNGPSALRVDFIVSWEIHLLTETQQVNSLTLISSPTVEKCVSRAAVSVCSYAEQRPSCKENYSGRKDLCLRGKAVP